MFVDKELNENSSDVEEYHDEPLEDEVYHDTELDDPNRFIEFNDREFVDNEFDIFKRTILKFSLLENFTEYFSPKIFRGKYL